MLSKCANPACYASFRRLSEGKLFVVEARQWGRVECFWLCDNCSLSLKLQFSSTRGVVIRSERPVLPRVCQHQCCLESAEFPEPWPGFSTGD